MDKELIEDIKYKIRHIEFLTEQLQEIAKGINPNKPWKRTLREDVGVVI